MQNRQSSSQRARPQPASIASIQRRFDVALGRIKQLRTENSDFATRLEMVYGEIRRLRGISHSGGLKPEEREEQVDHVPLCAPRATVENDRQVTGAAATVTGMKRAATTTPEGVPAR
ncbi:hypothetical protein PUR57_24920 [Streptomyces sp. JV176]|uniref:hypothetical protein n=1 Tax=Streptomyces sp. JV176 TaxID=858630 RepID=UPI002E75B441|nr:hypothetical protein [Streptomyces sp. JV176]MEE1801894.1 hypothetical protein [Streptomyces sp. JV176]